MSFILNALGSGLGSIGKAIWGGVKGLFKSRAAPVVNGL